MLWYYALVNLKTLRQEFGTEEQCLDFIFHTRFPQATGYYRIRGRKSYVNATGHQLHPLGGTIFHKTQVPLTLWFHALFLFYTSKNGVSAAELSRQLGIGYNAAFRMGHKIRSVMSDEGLLMGIVEVDETYFGGKHKQAVKFSKKKAIMGMVERGGRVRTKVIPHRGSEVLLPTLKENVAYGSHLMTDEFRVYEKVGHLGYSRQSVKHGKGHYVRGNVHTNSIEGYWGLLKPSMKGTFRSVSHHRLQSYLDEFSFRYNRRNQSNGFEELLERSLQTLS